MSTAFGVFVHDTNIDKATLSAVSSPIVRTADDSVKVVRPGSDPHTHPDRISISQAVRDVKKANARIQPRNQDDKKYIHHKKGGPLSNDDVLRIWPSV